MTISLFNEGIQKHKTFDWDMRLEEQKKKLREQSKVLTKIENTLAAESNGKIEKKFSIAGDNWQNRLS